MNQSPLLQTAINLPRHMVIDVSTLRSADDPVQIRPISQYPNGRFVAAHMYSPPISSDNAQSYLLAMQMMGPRYIHFANLFNQGLIVAEPQIVGSRWGQADTPSDFL